MNVHKISIWQAQIQKKKRVWNRLSDGQCCDLTAETLLNPPAFWSIIDTLGWVSMSFYYRVPSPSVCWEKRQHPAATSHSHPIKSNMFWVWTKKEIHSVLPKYKKDFLQSLITVFIIWSKQSGWWSVSVMGTELKCLERYSVFNLGNLLTKSHSRILLRHFFFFLKTHPLLGLAARRHGLLVYS